MGLGPAQGYQAILLGELNERFNADTVVIVPATPTQVRAAVVKAATTGVVVGHGSAPDRLLHVTA